VFLIKLNSISYHYIPFAISFSREATSDQEQYSR